MNSFWQKLLLAAGVFGCCAGGRAANVSCRFDTNTLAFPGTPLEQARCLLRPVRRFGVLANPLPKLPATLEELIGKPVSKKLLPALKSFLAGQGISEADIGGPLTNHCPAKYFVIHDTSTPNYGDSPIPTNINTSAWGLNNLARYTNRGAAHIFVNRLGQSVAPHRFANSKFSTKLEVRVLHELARGLFVHIELIQPRRRDPERGPKNNAIAPEPGFTEAQYDRLALLYVSASVQHGSWLIPGYHAAVDAGIPDAHDDPQNFDLALWARRLDALLKSLPPPN